MKKLLLILVLLFLSLIAIGQREYDDIYYLPSKDKDYHVKKEKKIKPVKTIQVTTYHFEPFSYSRHFSRLRFGFDIWYYEPYYFDDWFYFQFGPYGYSGYYGYNYWRYRFNYHYYDPWDWRYDYHYDHYYNWNNYLYNPPYYYTSPSTYRTPVRSVPSKSYVEYGRRERPSTMTQTITPRPESRREIVPQERRTSPQVRTPYNETRRNVSSTYNDPQLRREVVPQERRTTTPTMENRRNYTPSYSQPRMDVRPSFNNTRSSEPREINRSYSNPASRSYNAPERSFSSPQRNFESTTTESRRDFGNSSSSSSDFGSSSSRSGSTNSSGTHGTRR